jgi:glycosyltransferase involved in cell wall biosynthesis
VHPKILEMIAKGKRFDNQITIVPFGGKLSLPLWALDRFLSDRIRGFLLGRVLYSLSPDYLHALEFQNAGYISIRSPVRSREQVTFIATNYGSDIYWFQRIPSHLKRIRKVLESADVYSAECQRDVELAKQLGFRGTIMSVSPNAGGFESELLERKTLLTSERKTIAIKGYEGWAGRATVALEALASIAELLKGYKIIVYSAEAKTISLAKRIAKSHHISFTFYKKGGLTHEELLDVFSQSRIYVGLSITDGISTSLLEAMALGAFPIQTATSCASEWLTSESGRIIENLDSGSVASAIRFGLTNNHAVDLAATRNLETIRRRATKSRAALNAQHFYK